MSSIRRSTRAKRQATSIYDEARRDVEEQEEVNSEDERMSEAENDNEGGGGSDSESVPENADEESSDESSDDENEFKLKAAKRASSSGQKKRAPAKGGKIPIQVGAKKTRTKKASANAARKTGGKKTQPRRGASSALAALSRKVLHETETPDNALVAALLQSYKKPTGAKKTRAPTGDTTIYTQQLEAIAHKVVEEHKDDPNKAQITLLNLLFRSVGGSIDSNLDEEDTILEDMTGDEWATVITDLVDEMRHTPADRILFCADPGGAVHAAAVEASNAASSEVDKTPAATGVCEYRKIYEEFWYVLGSAALSDGSGNVVAEEDSEETGFSSSNTFGTEIVRELITRMTELITVGQPDVRAAATVAALQLGHALLNRTLELGSKLEAAGRQFRSAGGGKKDKLSRKAETLRHQMDSMKRVRADLEEIVHSTIVQGVFMHRYRDSNMHIRAFCIQSLSLMTLQRPDLFLDDKYLKYFGWMMSDKAACVRVASLTGLKAPFDVQREISKGTASKRYSPQIDPGAMENLLTRFLPRIVDCTIDTSVRVQEEAIALLRALVPAGIMENLEEDHLWQQLNSRALATDTTPAVRRDALYLVMDQLDSFDVNPGGGARTDEESRERLASQQLDALSSWVAHALCDGPIPIEEIRIELVDYVVQSLRMMPEHKALVTKWSVMLAAIANETAAATGEDRRNQDRADIAKQRVLVRMLACSAEAEVSAVADPTFLSNDLDPALVQIKQQEIIEEAASSSKKKNKKSYSAGMAHEELSVALLKALPDLLVKFKGDYALLRSITILPRYLLPSVCSLSQRKNDFSQLLKNLSELYTVATDETIMNNIVLSLSYMAKGEHARATDARMCLKHLAISLCDRTTDLLEATASETADLGSKRKAKGAAHPSKKSRRSRDQDSVSSRDSAESDEEAPSPSQSSETYTAIALCLKRLTLLSKRENLNVLVQEASGDGETIESTVLEDLSNAVVKEVATQLEARLTRDGTVSEIWDKVDSQVHMSLADTVDETLSFLYCSLAWRLAKVYSQSDAFLAEDEDAAPTEIDEAEEDEFEDHPAVVEREQLVKLLELCFSNFPEADEDVPAEQIEFSKRVQASAYKWASDLRALVPRALADSSSPLLSACALKNDRHLIGGSLRWFRHEEERLRDLAKEDADDPDVARELLVPLARSVGIDWQDGNRREAGILLSHITGSGQEASHLISSITRVLKKNEPVRMLESHMACLIQCFNDWIQNEPEELETDRPTDEEMKAFDEAEQKHFERFHLMEQMATRLCMSLGVGAWNDPRLSSGILNFLRKGLSFAFGHNEEDDLLLGCRLPFLSILSKYVARIRRNVQDLEDLSFDLTEREENLREHPDFSEVHEEDLAAISAFRNALGLSDDSPAEVSPSNSRAESMHSADDESSGGGTSVRGTAPSRRRMSKGSSVGSVRSSRLSTQNSLSPLLEEDADSLSSGSPTPEKKRGRTKRRLAGSFESSKTMSTLGKTIQEEEGSDEGEMEGESLST